MRNSILRNLFKLLVRMNGTNGASFYKIKNYLRILFIKESGTKYLASIESLYDESLLNQVDSIESAAVIEYFNENLNTEDKFKIILFYWELAKSNKRQIDARELFYKLNIPEVIFDDLQKIINISTAKEYYDTNSLVVSPEQYTVSEILYGLNVIENKVLKNSIYFYYLERLNITVFKLLNGNFRSDGPEASLFIPDLWYPLNEESKTRLAKLSINTDNVEKKIKSKTPIKDIHIKKTDYLPEIILSFEKATVEINGSSYLSSSYNYFMSLIDWIERCEQAGLKQLSMKFNFYLLDTRSSKLFLEFLKEIRAFIKRGMEISVTWCHEEDDNEMLEVGEIYTALVDVPFEFEVIEQTSR